MEEYYSELVEIYVDKLNEAFQMEGYPQQITMENENGDVLCYVLDEEYLENQSYLEDDKED